MIRKKLLAGLLLGTLLGPGCEPRAKQPAAGPLPTEPARPGPPPATRPAAPGWPANAVRGDFDGDGTAEYVWLVPPKGADTEQMECAGPCTSYLRFSNQRLPAIAKEDCIGGEPRNLGDLNGDGSDEIGLLPEWFVSCWMNFFVYTYRAGRWEPLVQSFPTHCDQWESEVKPIEKDPAHPGSVLIRYSELTDSAIVVKSKSVPVN